MPSVTFTWTRNASQDNTIFGPWGSASNNGTTTINIPFGASYTITGSGFNGIDLKARGSNVGLDDDRNGNPDDDYDDIIVYASEGSFSVSGSSVTYKFRDAIPGCGDPRANNYNAGAEAFDNSLCTYDPPTASISLNKSYIVNTGSQSATLTWSAGGVYDSVSVSNISGEGASGSKSVSPSSSTTYTITATGPGGNASASATLTVYQPPNINLSLGSSSIISGQSTTLNWSVSGNTTSTTINQGIGSVPNSGSTTINPTVTTTYTGSTTFNAPGEDSYSDSDSITLTVYQLPTLDITLPTDVNYGEDITLEYEYEYANISAKVTPQYRYRNANNDGFVNVTGAAVNLTPLSTSAEFGVPGTLVADKSVVLSPVYNDDGPFEINYTVEVKGNGGTETITQNVKINIDLTPDNIAIPDTFGEKDEEPVYTPDPDEYPDTELEIKDVDIPVEVKSNAPIKVSKDGGNTWSNVRQKA
jgi:hypothetical protein